MHCNEEWVNFHDPPLHPKNTLEFTKPSPCAHKKKLMVVREVTAAVYIYMEHLPAL